MEEYLKVFAQRLRALRIEKNLTQQELADMIGTVKVCSELNFFLFFHPASQLKTSVKIKKFF